MQREPGSFPQRVRRMSRVMRLTAVLGVAVVVAACSSGASQVSQETYHPVPVRNGGQVVIGAEQEPDCADWIGTCSGSIWGSYMMQVTTTPAAFHTRKENGKWVPAVSNLLTGVPKVSIVRGHQVITYRINPHAQWSDGEPITSSDFKYTVQQIRDGKDILDKSGYDQITKVTTPDPRTAVVTLKKTYASWRSLFQIVLPSHILQGKSRNAAMKNGYSWSGGPWRIASWKRGVSVTLVPNEHYWGPKPHLKKVTFQIITDTAGGFQALKSGQVDALYPSPQLDAIGQIRAGIPSTHAQIDATTGNLEAIWLNNAKFPFDSVAVRKALAYSVDRDAIVNRLFGAIGVDKAAQSFFTPILGGFGASAFSKYKLELGQVDRLMKGAGWRKDSDGYWAKNGRVASFAVQNLAGNQRRQLTAEMLQAQFKTAGFKMSIHAVSAADLFSKIAPQGNFQAALYTLIDTFPEPLNLSATFKSTNAPSKASGYSGINFGRVQIPGLDNELNRLDTTVNTTKRQESSRSIDRLIANAVPAIPLDDVPNVLLWGDNVSGPMSINPSEGPFWNLEQWGLVK